MPSLKPSRQTSPVRSSPRKASHNAANAPTTRSTATVLTAGSLPTPLSLSPTRSTSSFQSHRLPPSFDPHHTSSRYPGGTLHHTPFSPYRPGEYGRSERGLASERTKIERKLFDDESTLADHKLDADRDESMLPKQVTSKEGLEGSSPLAPAFEAKMVLRNGASIDLISWLRTNFHHIPESQHNSMTPSMSLIGIRALLLERFPRVPELTELSKAVSAAFPHSKWEASHGAFSKAEPPTLRGLIWHGKDAADEDDEDDEERMAEVERERERQRERERRPAQPHIVTRARASASGMVKGKSALDGSRSPTQSTLVSPISSSTRKAVPDTPARSVLEEFAEIATLADKTPASKAMSLPGDIIAPSPAYALANICNSFEDTGKEFGAEHTSRKRRASQSPEPSRRRASSPDKLHGLLAAAEAVEGSPITSVLGHKRRRTIGGPGTMRDVLNSGHGHRKHKFTSRGTESPAMRSFSFLPGVEEDSTGQETSLDNEFTADLLVPLNDTASAISLQDLDAASLAAQARNIQRDGTSSSISQASNISTQIPEPSKGSGAGQSNGNRNNVASGSGTGRRANELPTQGEAPGIDCKPPYPYHEMIRHAIESAPDCRLQLSQIYTTIADRFPFFKTLDEKKTAGWQNSIRHNLSLKKMFVRVNKVDGVPDDANGKGGWWTVQPGVPDEGRPGRKSKSKKSRHSGDAIESLVDGESVNGNGGDREPSVAPSFVSGSVRPEENGQNGASYSEYGYADEKARMDVQAQQQFHHALPEKHGEAGMLPPNLANWGNIPPYAH